MGGEQGAGREARRGTRREGAVPQAVPMGAEPSTEHLCAPWAGSPGSPKCRRPHRSPSPADRLFTALGG